MKAIIIEDSDACNLLDLLKLEKFKQADGKDITADTELAQMHSKFHYIVCRWLQEQGCSVVR